MWLVQSIGIVPAIILANGIFGSYLVRETMYVYLALALVAISYMVWKFTCKNFILLQGENLYKLRLGGRKLEFDAKFISQVWLDEDGLNIQRINRVDTFPVDHLKEQDVERLLQILKEYET